MLSLILGLFYLKAEGPRPSQKSSAYVTRIRAALRLQKLVGLMQQESVCESKTTQVLLDRLDTAVDRRQAVSHMHANTQRKSGGLISTKQTPYYVALCFKHIKSLKGEVLKT